MRLPGRFLRDESGATAIEYALIAIMLSIAIVFGATVIGTQLNVAFQGFATSLGGG